MIYSIHVYCIHSVCVCVCERERESILMYSIHVYCIYMYTVYTCILSIHVYWVYMYTQYTEYTEYTEYTVYWVYMYSVYTCILYIHVYSVYIYIGYFYDTIQYTQCVVYTHVCWGRSLGIHQYMYTEWGVWRPQYTSVYVYSACILSMYTESDLCVNL